MGFRFRRRFSLLPGFRVNLSKSGISTSIGEPGATVNLRGDQVRTTVGIPGSGVSYSQTSRSGVGGVALLILVLIVLAVVFGTW
ncbi:MAG: DUF4236 domain-containing protein [Betaproteobacteria bacterium]